MKRTLIILCALLLSLGVSAQQDSQSQRLADGFYRVQNHGTKRYAYIYDNVGSISISKTDADMGAVVLYHQENHDRFSDPASVCYVQKTAHKHNVFGQNTSFFDIISHYVQIQDAKDTNGNDCYRITPLYAGTYIYLRDGNASGNKSMTSSTVSGQNNETETSTNFEAFRWDFIPFSSTTNEYLGIAPNPALRIGDKYYKPYVVGFAMKLLSPGMKAYYVSEIKDDAVIIKEYTGDIIPANTPIIVECSTTEPTTNRVELFFDTPSALTGNVLSGNYFCWGKHSATDRLLYNTSEMRMLAVRDGKLTYVSDVNHEYTTLLKINGSENYYVPANESYLRVNSGLPDDLPVMTEEEYNATHGGAAQPGDADGSGSVNVADVNGNGGIVAMVLKQTAENILAADINKDGKITIADITLLIKQLISNK